MSTDRFEGIMILRNTRLALLLLSALWSCSSGQDKAAVSLPVEDVVYTTPLQNLQVSGHGQFSAVILGNGQSLRKNIELTNMGNEAINLSLNISGPHASAFTLVSQNCGQILGGKKCTVVISANTRQLSAGTYEAFLSSGTDFTLPLSLMVIPQPQSTGLSAYVDGQELINQDLLFGNLTGAQYSVKTVVVRNAGPQPALVQLNENYQKFLVYNNTCKQTLPAASTCQFNVLFSNSGKGVGNHAEDLILTPNFAVKARATSYVGVQSPVAQASDIEIYEHNTLLTASLLNLGKYETNKIASRVISVKNTSVHEAAINLTALTNFPVIVNGCADKVLKQNESCSFRIVFSSKDKNGVIQEVAQIGPKSLTIKAQVGEVAPELPDLAYKYIQWNYTGQYVSKAEPDVASALKSQYGGSLSQFPDGGQTYSLGLFPTNMAWSDTEFNGDFEVVYKLKFDVAPFMIFGFSDKLKARNFSLRGVVLFNDSRFYQSAHCFNTVSDPNNFSFNNSDLTKCDVGSSIPYAKLGTGEVYTLTFKRVQGKLTVQKDQEEVVTIKENYNQPVRPIVGLLAADPNFPLVSAQYKSQNASVGFYNPEQARGTLELTGSEILSPVLENKKTLVKTVHLQNDGTADFVYSSILSSNSAFTLENNTCQNRTLTPQEYCSVDIFLNPQGLTGTQTTTITAGNASFTVSSRVQSLGEAKPISWQFITSNITDDGQGTLTSKEPYGVGWVNSQSSLNYNTTNVTHSHNVLTDDFTIYYFIELEKNAEVYVGISPYLDNKYPYGSYGTNSLYGFKGVSLYLSNTTQTWPPTYTFSYNTLRLGGTYSYFPQIDNANKTHLVTVKRVGDKISYQVDESAPVDLATISGPIYPLALFGGPGLGSKLTSYVVEPKGFKPYIQAYDPYFLLKAQTAYTNNMTVKLNPILSADKYSKTYTIRNDGLADVEELELSLTGEDFKIVNQTCPIGEKFAVNQTCDFTLELDGSGRSGDYSTTLSFNEQKINFTQHVELVDVNTEIMTWGFKGGGINLNQYGGVSSIKPDPTYELSAPTPNHYLRYWDLVDNYGLEGDFSLFISLKTVHKDYSAETQEYSSGYLGNLFFGVTSKLEESIKNYTAAYEMTGVSYSARWIYSAKIKEPQTECLGLITAYGYMHGYYVNCEGNDNENTKYRKAADNHLAIIKRINGTVYVKVDNGPDQVLLENSSEPLKTVLGNYNNGTVINGVFVRKTVNSLPYVPGTSLLLHLDQNLQDHSQANSPYTITGNSTFLPYSPILNGTTLYESTAKFGNGAVQLNPTGPIKIANHHNLNFGAEDFTVDFWVTGQSLAQSNTVFLKQGTGIGSWSLEQGGATADSRGFLDDILGNFIGNLHLRLNASEATYLISSRAYILSQPSLITNLYPFVHVLFTRVNGEFKFFINGKNQTIEVLTVSDTPTDRMPSRRTKPFVGNASLYNSFQFTGGDFQLGGVHDPIFNNSSDNAVIMDELRVIKGQGYSGGDFTPPSTYYR